jgi:hypothetical protein
MKRSMLIAVALVAAWGFVGSAAPLGDEKVYTLENQGLRIQGRVTEDDAKVSITVSENKKVELPAKLYQIKLTAGRKYVSTMAGEVVDATLAIQNQAGKQLAFDDGENGKFFDAQVYFVPAKDGAFKFLAAARKGSGTFKLDVADIGPVLAKVHEVGSGLTLEGKLDQQTRGITYKIKLLAGKDYIIDMTSPDWDKLDPYLYLFDAKEKKIAEDDDSGGGRNAKIVTRAPATGEYQLLAASFQWRGQGPFTVIVKERSAAVPATLEGGVFMADGKLVKEDPIDRVLSKSPHKAYSVQMKAGKTYTIDLVSSDFDALLRLEDSAGKQLAIDDDSGGGSDARIVFEASKTETYQLIVTSLDKKTGNYKLTVREK